MKKGDKVYFNFKNIGCLKEGRLEINFQKLNIKYGYNGLGKSTIAVALNNYINNIIDESKNIIPFCNSEPTYDLKNSKNNLVTEFKRSITFNDSFIDSWLFQPDETIKNSYSIILNNDEIKKNYEQLEGVFKSIKSLIKSNLDNFCRDFQKIYSSLKVENHKIDKRGKFAKGFKNAANIAENIKSTEAKDYYPYMVSANSQVWSDWFRKGVDYILDDRCPFCLEKLKDTFETAKASLIDYIKNIDFKNNYLAKTAIVDLSKLTEVDKREKLLKINEYTTAIDEKAVSIIDKAYSKAYSEKEKINTIIQYDLNEINPNITLESVIKFFENIKLDEDYFKNLKNEELLKEVKDLNLEIENLLTKANEFVEEKLNYDKIIIEALTKTETQINNFLVLAGIPYKFKIEDFNGKKITKIYAIGNGSALDSPTKYLSYGEKNALALALFGSICKLSNYDLIILDDPISSFDENKKFALLHYLFNQKDGALNDKTTILFTHDIIPLIETVHKRLVDIKSRYAKGYLLYLEDNKLKEKILSSDDFDSAINLELNEINNENEIYFKVVHLRKKYEIENNNKDAAYQLLSSAEHLRKTASNSDEKELSKEEIRKGTEEIRKYISDFEYENFIKEHTLKKLFELYDGSQTDTKKLIITRVIYDSLGEYYKENKNVVLGNFINEQYHIEHLYLYGIKGINTIPPYIIRLCDELVEDIRKKISFDK